jgi:hypothetical protein
MIQYSIFLIDNSARMKGIVFTEFLEMVEDRFGFSTVDQIIEASDLSSGGVYTAVGTYDSSEMFSLVGHLSAKSGIPVTELLRVYGQHLFTRFALGYGHFFSKVEDSFQFLEQIENYIHIEVRKLYPDAELPHIRTERVNADQLALYYSSERKMGHFALGLIEGCGAHYEENFRIDMENIHPSGSEVKFTISR